MTIFSFCLSLVILSAGGAFAQTNYALEVLRNGKPISWQAQDLESSDGSFTTDADSLTVNFEGGRLELALTDFGNFSYAHVLGVDLTKTAPETYRVAATVRHHDQGWDNYANAFEVKGERVENGLRELLHPHDNEQPFTRAQSGVRATGLVQIAARDNVEGWGGSTIFIDLDTVALNEGERLELRYELTISEASD